MGGNDSAGGNIIGEVSVPEIKPLSLKNMNIRLDAVTAQMLKEVMKKNRQNDAKKFLTEQIRRMYLSL